MKQLVQNLRTGETLLLDVPAPLVRRGCVLIRTRKSLVSAGTERMLIEFSKASFLQKARQQPDKLRLVLEKLKTDGLRKTVRSVMRRLDELMPLGYCQAGEIVAIGEGVGHFSIGDRVISNGPHAQMVCVPMNLVAKIPPEVPDEAAAFTVLGAVGLHGVRLLGCTLGERVAVIGLGLIGLMAVDLLRAQGCEVIGVEPDTIRRRIAAEKGITTVSPEEYTGKQFTDRFGEVDGLIITASSRSRGIIALASAICRKRGKIVLIGDVPLHLNRTDFYQKELTFQVSCSYGPGRYDRSYEENGVDYPLPYVRWTENRNFQEVLRLLACGALNVKPLVSKVISLQDYPLGHALGDAQPGVLIDYPAAPSACESIVRHAAEPQARQHVVAAIIGAGNFVRMTLLPSLRGKYVKYIASSSGLRASELARKYGIPNAVSDYKAALNDPEVNLVVIATQHDSHASMAAEALATGKHVFVEKPLSIDVQGLEKVQCSVENGFAASLSVGFNRRYAPHVSRMRQLLGDAPMNVIITVNAGHVPGQAWVHDAARGGGRLTGEGCHFIDLVAWIAQSRITEVCTNALAAGQTASSENVSVLIRLANGSSGVVHYFSRGARSYPKERVEVHSLGRTLVLDDYKMLRGYGFEAFRAMKADGGKGHQEQFDRLFECIASGKTPLMPLEDIWNSSRATLAARESMWMGGWVKVP